MPLAQRAFAEVLADFSASNPKKKPKSFDRTHYAAQAAWSFKNLSAWPSNPPVTSLYHMPDPTGHSEEVLRSAKALVDYAHFGTAIGTWNARGSGAWTGDGATWILASVSLTQEQADDGYEGAGDAVDLLLAVWQLTDGWAAAVLRDTERDLALRLLGLDAWPDAGWQREDVWYGE